MIRMLSPFVFVALAACASSQPDARFALALASTPEGRATMREVCADELRGGLKPHEIGTLAGFLDVDAALVPEVYCDRLTSAIGRGDISEAEYAEVMSGAPSEATAAKMTRLLTVPGETEASI